MVRDGGTARRRTRSVSIRSSVSGRQYPVAAPIASTDVGCAFAPFGDRHNTTAITISHTHHATYPMKLVIVAGPTRNGTSTPVAMSAAAA